jgi:hypothetical protein
MRNLVPPPPSLHCDYCGGELRLKQIEPHGVFFECDTEILVCVRCGHERSYRVSHDRYAARTASNMLPARVG